MSDRISHDLGHFAMVPERVVAKVSPAALKLWCLLWIYTGNGTHEGWPAQSRLAGDMGCSARTVQRHLDELITLGALSTQHRAGTSNLYTLHWRPVDNPRNRVTNVVPPYDTHVVPPTTPVSYKERQSEIHNHQHPKPDNRDHVRAPGDAPLTREQIRKIREQAGGR